jgi:hypothetical protein
MNDRALREIEIGLGGAQNGVPRKTGFDITPASEVMAILGLAKDLERPAPAPRRASWSLRARGRGAGHGRRT